MVQYLEAAKRYASARNVLIVVALLAVLYLWFRSRVKKATQALIPGSPGDLGSSVMNMLPGISMPLSITKAVWDRVSSMFNLPTPGKPAPVANTAAKQAAAQYIQERYKTDTPSRAARAERLRQEFQAKKYLRIKFLETVQANEGTFDLFKAWHNTGAKIQYPKGKILERGRGFISTALKVSGNVVILDSYSKKFYAVNPNLITLV